MPEQTKGPHAVIYGLMLMLGGIAMICIFVGADQYPPLDEPQLVAESAKYSIPAALTVATLLYLAHGQALFNARHRWPMLLGLVLSFFVSGTAIAYHYNGRTDVNDGVEKVLPILDKRMLNSRGIKTYYIVVTSWRSGRDEERLKVSRTQYESVNLPAEIKFTLRKGALNYAWVKEYSLIESN